MTTTRAGIGHSDHPHSETAALLATRAALANMGATCCDLVLVFSTHHHDQERVLAAVRKVVGSETRIIGTGSAGILSTAQQAAEGAQVGVCVLRSDALQSELFRSSGLAVDERATGHAIERHGRDERTTREAVAPVMYESVSPLAQTKIRTCRREGDYWTLTYGTSLLRLRDAKGLEYLARLLSHPKEPIHVLDLVTFGAPVPSDARGTADLSVRRGSDAGPVLDAAAKAAYRARLRELDEELHDARHGGDHGQAQRVEEEMEALVNQLSSALGLGGRDRKAASATERARVNVQRALKSVVEKVRTTHGDLAKHLQASLQTGAFCVYMPHAGVQEHWDVSMH